MGRLAALLRYLNIGTSQVQVPAGPPGFGLRLALALADRDCPCGGEHLSMDHEDASQGER